MKYDELISLMQTDKNDREQQLQNVMKQIRTNCNFDILDLEEKNKNLYDQFYDYIYKADITVKQNKKLNTEIEWLLEQLKETKLECEHKIVDVKEQAKVELKAAVEQVK